MSDSIRRLRAEWVLPVASPPIPNGEVVIDSGGRIVSVAPAGAVDLPDSAPITDLGRAILLPGLVNVHAHPELAMFRGMLEDLPFRDWILRLVGAKRLALREGDALHAARWTTVEALAAGMTTLAATETSGAAARALSEAGMRGVVYQEVFGPDPRTAAASIQDLGAAVDELRPFESDRIRIGVSPHAPYTVSDTLYRATAEFARREGLPVAVHIAESRAERDLVTRGDGDFAAGLRARDITVGPRASSPVQLLDRVGILELRPLLIHCVDIDEEDIRTIAAAGAPIAHCPIANAKLGHGVSPIAELRAAGVTVALGTDSVASNNRLDLLEEARFTSLMQRAIRTDPVVLPAGELLKLCTIDGARALGMEDRIGSLEPGKYADLCAVAIDSAHTVPVADPLTTLFHAARGSDVILTMVGGEVLYERGRYPHLDVRALSAAVEDVARRIGDVL